MNKLCKSCDKEFFVNRIDKIYCSRTCKSYGKILKLYPPTRPITQFCECCGNKNTGKYEKYKICLDHDHSTNEFRGWLCHKCNRALGLLGDKEENVKKLLNYLQIKKG
jgi:hypothetical protein